jgi:hypothetical protein
MPDQGTLYQGEAIANYSYIISPIKKGLMEPEYNFLRIGSGPV